MAIRMFCKKRINPQNILRKKGDEILMDEYKIIISIDKVQLSKTSNNDDVIAAIEQELGWTEQSGIRVKSIEKIEEKEPKKSQPKDKDLLF